MPDQKGSASLIIIVIFILASLGIIGGSFYAKNLQAKLNPSKYSASVPPSPKKPITDSTTPLPKPTPTAKALSMIECLNKPRVNIPVIPVAKIDHSIISEARMAFIAKGFSGSWFDQHLQLQNAETHTGISFDPSKGCQNEIITSLTYKISVNEYSFEIKYDHSDDGNSNSFVEIYAPTHDINQVISSNQAKEALKNCGGTLIGSSNIVFQDIEDSGALFPNQTRLYMKQSLSDKSSNAGNVILALAVPGGKSGIITVKTANVDLETGKCFITTQGFGI